MHHRKQFAGTLVCGCAAVMLGTNEAMAQEALRTALESEAAARVRNEPVERPPDARVLRWGAATFDISLSYSLEATDNSTYVETDRRKDLIQRPTLEVGVLLQLSPQSRLDFRTGIGYEDYIDNSVEDTFFISPGSEIALDVRVGNGVVTFFDRLDYSQEVVSQGGLAGVGRFPQLQNVVGVRSVWRFDQWRYHADYSHLNVFITEDSGVGTADFSYLERSEELFYGRAGYHFDNPVELGIEGTGSLADYVSEVQRDYWNVSAGPYLTWTAADALEITLRGGGLYTVYSSTGIVAGDEDDVTTYYAGLLLDHRLTDYVTYGFAATHDVRPAISSGSDYIETTRLQFDLDWHMTTNLIWAAEIFGEKAEEVGTLFTEEYRRFGVSVGPLYHMTRHFSFFARYAFNLRDSEVESRSYRENRASIGLTYRF